MKAKKILAQLRGLLDSDRKTQAREIKTLQKLLKKLKEKERTLEAKLQDTQEPAQREKLQEKLDVIYRQRRKGIDRVRELKAELTS